MVHKKEKLTQKERKAQEKFLANLQIKKRKTKKPVIVAIIGLVGSGKSSVMNAICFGLFGTFPDLQSRKIKIDDVIMNKPSSKQESQVVVDFTVGGKDYSVMRIIERNKGTTYSEIREGEKLLDSPNTQRVTDLVEKLETQKTAGIGLANIETRLKLIYPNKYSFVINDVLETFIVELKIQYKHEN